MTASRRTERLIRIGDPEPEDDITTPEERVDMMWSLAVTAWAFLGDTVEPRLSRHVECVLRTQG